MIRTRGIRATFLLTTALALAGLLSAPGYAKAQGLADFDYDNLSFRGVMLDAGYVFSSRVEGTPSFGGRLDLGFLGPGVRAVAGFNRWSSYLAPGEVADLETRLEELIFDQTGDVIDVNLGRISWSDVALNGDLHFLWRVPFGLLTYAGVGASAHILRGGGGAIQGTFIDDLLDSVRAGVNLHGGVELPMHRRFRVVGEGRYELLENLSYFQLRVGGQFMFGALAPGEQ